MIHFLTLPVAGDQAPTEFRLFTKGWNLTKKGRFLFDGAAARAVMADYRAWGVDLSIDLEHQMLDEHGADPTDRDARGWMQLEVRPDGSLWAVNVRWTPDGAERLAQKRQRYISPAFESDPKTKRVEKILNAAITSIPATNKTPALVAASGRGKSMDPKLVRQALEAIESGDSKAAAEILKNLIAAAAGADDTEDGDADGSEGDGAEGTAPPAETETESAEDPKVVANGGDPGEGDEEEDDKAPPAKKAAYKAMRATLSRLTGGKNIVEVLSRVLEYKAAYDSRELDQQKLRKDRAAIEANERRELCVELIKLGAEFPATVWADPKAKTLKARWSKMPLVELRQVVGDHKAARGPRKPGAIQPPAGDAQPSEHADVDLAAEVAALSAVDLAICKDTNCDPKEFVRLRRFRDKGNTKHLQEMRARETAAIHLVSGKGN